MDLELNNKVIAITGASKGIGFACAEAFARDGACVALIARTESVLKTACVQLEKCAKAPIAFAADLTRAEDAKLVMGAIEQQLGPIDVLVNCAGAARRYPPEELDSQAWREGMDAKFFTYIHAIDAVLPRMLARQSGAIINIIEIGGKVGMPTHLPGGAANAALMLATVGLANAFGDKGIRVNGINPGPTLTGRVQRGLAVQAKMTGLDEAELFKQRKQSLPRARFCTPEEVATVVMFLASERSSYINGAIIPIDGGANPII